MRKFHIIGNWKMNQGIGEIKDFFTNLSKLPRTNCLKGIAPQAIHLTLVKKLSTSSWTGAQNISQHNSGAFTGELSPVSLKEIGAEFTLIGHSERRSIFNETDEILNHKTKKALEHGLKVIFCVGESLAQRDKGQTMEIVLGQLKNGLKDIEQRFLENIIIAYEPVWAIGTGKTATPDQAQEIHSSIRKFASTLGLSSSKLIILYGGSVKPSNAKKLLIQPDIDGALVGGASLNAEDFNTLCQIADEVQK